VKKLIVLLLLPVFILTATVGVTLTSYSCKGMEAKAMDAPCCKDVKKGGCCEKQSVILKIKDAFVKASSNANLSTVFYLIQEQSYSFSFISVSKEDSNAKGHWDNAPPSPKVGYYILHRSIII